MQYVFTRFFVCPTSEIIIQKYRTIRNVMRKLSLSVLFALLCCVQYAVFFSTRGRMRFYRIRFVRKLLGKIVNSRIHTAELKVGLKRFKLRVERLYLILLRTTAVDLLPI